MSIIQVENISKRYIIFHKSGQKSKYNSLGESMNNQMRAIFGFGRNKNNFRENKREEFWALNDVSFEVNQGDKIGIIGRNGAGKSTLLKILSRITEPTKGRVKIKGRVASLLEVGTGFHPELTGRENIFLNGAILGMKKDEIKKKFDEIVAFSEIEKFLDTPVKRYSSGMYVRLAFSVAAHLEPEILLVDEVLAVGDYEFQKKCLGKMDEVAGKGRTIVFVSHNMLAIRNFCNIGILINKGKLDLIDNISKVVENYLHTGCLRQYTSDEFGNNDSSKLLFASVEQNSQNIIYWDKKFIIRLKWFISQNVFNETNIGIGINTQDGLRIFSSTPKDKNIFTVEGSGYYVAEIVIPPEILMPGNYLLDIALWSREGIIEYLNPALNFAIEGTPIGVLRDGGKRPGIVNIICDWNVEKYF